jgi:hypothetical protein
MLRTMVRTMAVAHTAGPRRLMIEVLTVGPHLRMIAALMDDPRLRLPMAEARVCAQCRLMAVGVMAEAELPRMVGEVMAAEAGPHPTVVEVAAGSPAVVDTPAVVEDTPQPRAIAQAAEVVEAVRTTAAAPTVAITNFTFNAGKTRRLRAAFSLGGPLITSFRLLSGQRLRKQSSHSMFRSALCPRCTLSRRSHRSPSFGDFFSLETPEHKAVELHLLAR